MKTNEEKLNITRKYRKTRKGLITNLYLKLKERNKVDFDKEFLINFSLCKKFERLYIEWVKSGFKKHKKPSIDRIYFRKHYTKDNIQWLTWEENRYKQRMEMKFIKGKPIGKFLNGVLVDKFKNVSEAVRNIGANQGNLSSCLNGKVKTVKGFEWKYIHENPELLK